MNVSPIDTYEVVQELKAAGFTEAQAEAVTRVVRKSQDIDLSNLATKTDLMALKTDLMAVKTELQLGMAEMRTEILKWVIGSMGLQTVAILGAVLALVRAMAR